MTHPESEPRSGVTPVEPQQPTGSGSEGVDRDDDHARSWIPAWPALPGAPRSGGSDDSAAGPALPAADATLAAAEGASPFMVRAVSEIAQRWPAVGRYAAFCVAVYGRYARHRGAVLAGGLAFFGMLSLVPSMLTLGALVALVVDPSQFVADLRGALVEHPEAAGTLAPVTDQLATMSTSSQTSIGIAGLVGLGFSLYAASRFVYVGRQVLDIAFEVEPRPPSIFARGVSIGITLVFQIAVLVGLALLSVIPRILERLGLVDASFGTSTPVRTLVALPIVYVLLTLGMRYGTALRTVPWVNLGGAVGALIIVVGTWGLGWYLSVSVTYSQIVAVLGGVIALELWLYVVGLALVLSAEVEALRLGRWHVRPERLGESGPVPSG